MRAYKLTEPKKIEKVEWNDPCSKEGLTNIRLTKSMIALGDIVSYNGEDDFKEIVPGSYGVGVVSEVPENLYDIRRGDRVFVAPTTNCQECYNCVTGNADKCSDFQVAGNNSDGFLRDFYATELANVYKLPQAVTDDVALYLEYVAKSIAIIDAMNVRKGDHVAIIGAGNLGNILSQIMIYYQCVPILIDNDKTQLANAEKSGVYYRVSTDDNPQKYINNVTAGRFCKGVVYITESYINPKVAFSLASFGAPVVITGTTSRSPKIDLTLACEKQLTIMCVTNGFGNTASAINLVNNKAVNFAYLPVNKISFNEVPALFKKGNAAFEKKETFVNAIVDLM